MDDLTPNQTVAANLRRIRERKQLTQAKAAEWLGWSVESYAQAERSAKGKRARRFDADELYAIAAAFDTTVAALLCPRPATAIAGDPPQELAIQVFSHDEHAHDALRELLDSLPEPAQAKIQGGLDVRADRLKQAELEGTQNALKEAKDAIEVADLLVARAQARP
jgi:transcriptional regulator with XRE-family HTH domain